MRIIILSILISLSFNLFSQKENKYIREGNDMYEDQNFKDAEVDYMKALEANADSYKGQYNLGGALYKQDNYEDASKLYNNLTSRDVDKNAKADAYYNLGNSLLKTQKYPESIEAYKNALRNNPDDMDAKYNMEYAKKMLKQQQQQQQQQQDQDKNEDKEKKEEQEKEQQQQDQEQQQNQQQEQQKQQQQPQPQQISKQDAERMLEALKNDEKKTLEKLKLQKIQKAKVRKVEKDW